jgi:hypothetical protein
MSFFRRARREQELDEEIRSHLEMALDERVARGKSRENAVRAVSVTGAREGGHTRAMWGWLWLERLVQDLVFGFHSPRLEPAFTVVAILTIGLGVGVTTSMFTIVNGVLLRPLPVFKSDHVVSVAVGRTDWVANQEYTVVVAPMPSPSPSATPAAKPGLRRGVRADTRKSLINDPITSPLPTSRFLRLTRSLTDLGLHHWMQLTTTRWWRHRRAADQETPASISSPYLSTISPTTTFVS